MRGRSSQEEKYAVTAYQPLIAQHLKHLSEISACVRQKFHRMCNPFPRIKGMGRR